MSVCIQAHVSQHTNDMKPNNVEQDAGTVLLEWIGLDRLSVKSSTKSFLDAQFAFFQSFQPIASESQLSKYTTYPKPDLLFLKSILRSIHQPQSAACTLIIHGVFEQYTVKSIHLMTPFIHCLEMLFDETNKISVEHHLKICLWMLSLYENLRTTHTYLDLNFNQCVCETVKFHQANNNLQISIKNTIIERNCYQKHLTPLQILLKNIHPKQRKCATLDISTLLRSMLSYMKMHEYLSTLYITINQRNELIASKENIWRCTVCETLNNIASNICEICDIAKPTEEYTLLSNDDAAKYKNYLAERCTNNKVYIRTAGLHINVNINNLSIGHIRLLFNYGIMPITIRIKDECKKIICAIDVSELLWRYDSEFSVLECSKCFEDVYLLLVLHYEAKKILIRALSVSELCYHLVFRNYFELICEFVCGEKLSNDDIYDNNLRMQYCERMLRKINGNHDINAQALEFFIYWVSTYCVTDANFLSYYETRGNIKELMDFCMSRYELCGLSHCLVADSCETYNSYHE